MTSSHELSPALLPLLQIVAVLLITAACGRASQFLRQPRVVGEIAGGILLGPLVLGHILPALSATLFPPQHLQALMFISNIGLVLFLFLTGVELDIAAVRENRGAALAITIGNVGLPFALSGVFSPMLRAHFGLVHVSPLGFFLFTGIAMSITALPILARVINERKLRNPLNPGKIIEPHLAATALVCAAVNDLLAWSLLAVALTLIHSHSAGHDAATTTRRMLILAAYLAVMLAIVRPLIRRLLRASGPRPHLVLWLPCLVAFAFLNANLTDALGVQTFIGAFLAGVCVPLAAGKSNAAATANAAGIALDRSLQRTLQPIIRFTLPFFFALTGLRMQTVAFSSDSLRWFALVLGISVVGKILGGAIPARAAGMRPRLAAQMGILMNARGLVELVILNIGLKEGVISPLLFTLFVLMALVTTAMTVPLLDLLDLFDRRPFRGQPGSSPA